SLLGAAGYYDEVGGDGPERWLLPLALTGALLTFGWTLSAFDKGRLMLTLLLLWLTPVLAASVLAVAQTDWNEPAMWISALSPGATIGYAAAYPNIIQEVPEVATPMGRA